MIDPLTVDPETLDLASARYALGEMQLRVQDMAGRDDVEVFTLCGVFGIQKVAARILQFLMTGGVKRRLAITSACLPRSAEYYDSTDGAPTVLGVHICRLRKALRSRSLTITTVHGVGYVMPPADIARIRTMLEERSW